MKKLDKLIIKSFIGPFIMTFLVVVFILLTQHMLKYFDDIIGKDLGWSVVGQLLFYFAIFMVPVAMPLAVLLSSLIAFGNLGEHFELTAIKASGISLVRTLQPIFFFVLVLTGFAFYVNNNLVPKAALEAYSLLYDIKQKKPALDLREGVFYNGINDISIKVNEKFPDGITLKDIIVYDHRKADGNKEVTMADSGKMYTILNERYLKFELFNGYRYTEGTSDKDIGGKRNSSAETMTRSQFSKTQVVFDLSSFALSRTDKKWFQGNRIMRNLGELDYDMDSLRDQVLQQRLNHYTYRQTYFNYLFKNDDLDMPEEVEEYQYFRDSVNRRKYMKYDSVTAAGDSVKVKERPFLATRRKKRERIDRPAVVNDVQEPAQATLDFVSDSVRLAKIDSVFNAPLRYDRAQNVTNMARQVKSQLGNTNTAIESYKKEFVVFEIQWHKILASSLACVAMFLIGAPLGAIIKKGGLGIPFLVSILFFIVYYILNMQGEKLAKTGTVSAMAGVWAADVILFIVGLLFLRQARIDARLFEADFYQVVIDRVKKWFQVRRSRALRTAS